MGSPRWLPELAPQNTWHGGTLDVCAAADQWEALRDAVERRVGAVSVLGPAPWAAATTFVRDLGLVVEGDLVRLQPSGLRGRLEPPLLARALAAAGVEFDHRVAPLELDGGNVLADHHGRLVVGLCGEPDAAMQSAVDALKLRTGRAVLGVPLAGGRWPHLDMAMADLGGRGWLVYPAALAGYDRSDPAWRAVFAGRPVIEVDVEEGERLGCNVLVAGDVVIGPPVEARTRTGIESLGFDYEPADVGELTKAGGGVHCLTLELPSRGSGAPKAATS
jgi:N-dimethylarginine dimethylaminohydrolase